MAQKKKIPSPRNSKPRAIDLFSGCGGLTLGLKQAGFRVLSAVEIDPLAASTYKANHKDVLIKNTDIRDIDPEGLRKELKLRRGQLELLAGCPPCQGFSSLRTQNGAKQNRDVRNGLVGQMLRFAREFRPRAIMMENVPRLEDKKLLKDLCRGLRAEGYQVRVGVKDAADYGVPQRRRRLILLAGRGFDIDFAKESTRLRTVRGAIRGLSKPGRSRDALHNFPERERSARIRKLIRDIPKNGGSRGDLPKRRQLECHKKSNGFSDIYGRMAWDEVAPTITSGCSNPSKGRFLHPTENRAITLREAALLQGFPRKYEFDLTKGKEAVALLIGNALPPEFIKRHALAVRGALKDAKRLSRKSGQAT